MTICQLDSKVSWVSEVGPAQQFIREERHRTRERDLRTVGGVLDGNLNDERRQRKMEGQARTQSYSLLSTQMPIRDTHTLGPGNFCFVFGRSHT